MLRSDRRLCIRRPSANHGRTVHAKLSGKKTAEEVLSILQSRRGETSGSQGPASGALSRNGPGSTGTRNHSQPFKILHLQAFCSPSIPLHYQLPRSGGPVPAGQPSVKTLGFTYGKLGLRILNHLGSLSVCQTRRTRRSVQMRFQCPSTAVSLRRPVYAASRPIDMHPFPIDHTNPPAECGSSGPRQEFL